MPRAERLGKNRNREERKARQEDAFGVPRNSEVPEGLERVYEEFGGIEEIRSSFVACGERAVYENRDAVEKVANSGAGVLSVLDEERYEIACKVLREEMKHYPEFKEGAARLVSGSFGGLGNPSSFHSPMMRILRETVLVVVRPLFRALAEHKGYDLAECFLQQLFDRVVKRTEGDKIPAEQWHRDTCSENVRPPKPFCPRVSSSESEIRVPKIQQSASGAAQLYGGWLNLNGNPNQAQYFSCILGTHSDEEFGPGFDKVSKEEIAKFSSKEFCKVRIKPGQLLIFRQNMIHEVCSYKVGKDELRVHFAFNFSNKGPRPPMFGEEYLATTINRQRTPLLPSGQLPPMYSKSGVSFRPDALCEWARRTLKDEFLHEAEFGPTSKRSGDTYTKCHRFIMELRERFWPAYSKRDIEVMQPMPLVGDGNSALDE